MQPMKNSRGRSPAPPRLVVTAVAVAVVVALTPGAADAGVTPGEIAGAQERYRALQEEIAAKQDQLEAIQDQSNELAVRVNEANAQLQAIIVRLNETRARLDRARATYDARIELLNDRAREAFISGGAGSSLDFLLSADSLADFTDRLQFVDQVTSSDADVATQVENLRTQLSQSARELSRLQAHQRAVVDELVARQTELDRKFAEQEALVADIKAKREEAARAISELKRKRRRQLAAQLAAATASAGQVSNGVFKNCPVGQPRAFGDDFGAPRYAGGFHLHMGNDILAPNGTPIYAPFDGFAYSSPNGLGGQAVWVRGSAGSVYNAHLSSYGTLGNVSAGTVIGYVGTSGDAQGGPAHDHFEWHPNALPSDWPASSYGYSVIDDAANPHPLLEAVC
jgi:peptidoglycan hydrolase CwlO-like protein